MTSFWDTLFDSEYKQRCDINDAAAELDDMRSVVRDLQHSESTSKSKTAPQQEIYRLELRLEKLKQAHLRLRGRMDRVELVTEALFVHLESTGSLDRSRLRELIEQIDAADGKVDGRARKQPTKQR